MDWEKAEKYLSQMKQGYASIGPSGNFGLMMVIIPLENRFASGERSEELYQEIMSLE